MGWTFYSSSGQKLSSANTSVEVLDIDGATDIGAAIVDADLFIIDDGAGGTNRKTAASRIVTYVAANMQADQAAMEAETDENTYAPPDLIKHSPGVAKVWNTWNNVDQSILESYNIASIADGGATGETDHTFTTEFGTGDTDYAVVGAGQQNYSIYTGGGGASKSVSVVSTITLLTTTAAAADRTENYMAIFGEQ